MVIFDLDDTLYYEQDFLLSAYREIAGIVDTENIKQVFEEMKNMFFAGNKDVFSGILDKNPQCRLSKQELIRVYRNHYPNISLNEGAKELFNFLKKTDISVGIITDGRSVTQRNKIKALNLDIKNENIIISEEFGTEKPNPTNFEYFMSKYPKSKFVYIGDNTKKDFISPNKLGWTTICLINKGKNIHKQDFNIPNEFLPKYKVNSLIEIMAILQLPI